MSVHAFWIPIEDGVLECCCCGVHGGGATLPCGDHYCWICEGRGHHQDHSEDECKHGQASPPFHRMDWDCVACGRRHLDWETCAELIYAFARRDGREPRLWDHYRIVDGVVEEAD